MGANCFKRIIKKNWGQNLFLLGANKIFFRGKCEWKRGIFLMFGAFVNAGGNFIFSVGNFMNIRVNQSKIVGKLKNFGGNFKK